MDQCKSDMQRVRLMHLMTGKKTRHSLGTTLNHCNVDN